MEICLPYNFKLRDYQVAPWNAILDPDFKRGIMVVPRRNGKDIVCWNALIAKAMQRVALYYYIAPYYNQIRQIIWEGFDGKGQRFLSYIPDELIANKTKLDMRIDLVNGSQIKLQGSDQIDRIVGTNPFGIVFTEFSLHKPGAWEYLRPILAENGGWAMFNGTPRGMNHFYHLYEAANKGESLYPWFTQYLTRDDTGVPTLEAIEEDVRSGMPKALVQQEYYCSFTAGDVGSYYGDYMQWLQENDHLTRVPWDPNKEVFTSWDIGVNDSTAIWFWQALPREFHLIDYYENNNKTLQHYIRILREKPYVYEDHYGPFDFEAREFVGDGGETPKTRKERAEEMGLIITLAPKMNIGDSHDLVRSILPMCYFDTHNCMDGINTLRGYKKKFDEKNQAYLDTPVRNWAKHGADAFKTGAFYVDAMKAGKIWTAPTVNRALTRSMAQPTPAPDPMMDLYNAVV